MLENLQSNKNKVVLCRVAKLIAGLQPSDQKILQAAVDNPQLWAANTLSNSLRSLGLFVADNTITRHRTRHCTCFRASL